MKRINFFIIAAVITYIAAAYAVTELILKAKEINWGAVIVFSAGILALGGMYLFIFRYLHEQTLYVLENEKAEKLAKEEKEISSNRKALEAERLKNERIDFVIKTAVEIAKMEIGKVGAGSESKSEGQGEGKSILAEKVEKIVVLISELDGDYKKSVGSLSDLNEQVKSLSKALESAIKGNMTIHDGVKGLSRVTPE